LDQKVTGEKLDHLVCPELQVFMDAQESKDLRENLVSPDATEPRVTVEQTENVVWTDQLVPRVSVEKMDLVVNPETVSTLSRESRDRKENQDVMVAMDSVEKTEKLEIVV